MLISDLMESKMSSSNYKHQSGSLKRKIQAERLRKESVGRQTITKFFKSNSEQQANEAQHLTVSSPSSETIECSTTEHDHFQMQPTCSSAGLNLEIIEDTSSFQPESLPDDDKKEVSTEPVLILNPNNVKNYDDIDDTYAALDSDNSNLEDPGTWPSKISDNLRQKIVSSYAGFSTIQSLTKCFPKDVNGKNFQDSLLYKKTADERTRKQFPREWLIWSKTKETLHCLPCTIFPDTTNDTSASRLSQLSKDGFSPREKAWKRLYNILPKHENSSEHRKNYLLWKTLQTSLRGFGVDNNLQHLIQCEAEKWRAILQRILDTTLFLASRGLAFQGENTEIGNVHNGNFLGILELIGKYDEVTRQHLAKVKQQQLEKKDMHGQVHYLSWNSQNEFIALCGEKLLETILNQREEAIFYGLIVDATPDVSHQEQNVLILRYVLRNDETSSFEIYERFIKFINFSGKCGEAISQQILSTLETLNVPLADCRSQGYDNGSNMRGDINGVKARLLELNDSAIFSPCGAHSLNRVGVNAAKLNHEVMTFFGNIGSFYCLFSHSPARWEMLKRHIPLSLQSLSETRWSERIQAVRPIVKHYPGVLKVLDFLLEDTITTLTPSARNIVLGLKKYFGSFKGLLMTSFWHKVLSGIDSKNTVIQSKGISLNTEVQLIKDLLGEMQQLRDSWETIVHEAKIVAEAIKITPSFDTNFRRRGTTDPMNEIDVQKQKEDDFKASVVFPVLDFIMTDLTTRFSAANSICDLFSPVLNFMDAKQDELEIKTKNLIEKFPKDFTEELLEEVIHLKNIHHTVFGSEKKPLKLLNLIYEKNLQAIFANVCIALKLFCTVPVTVSTAERSFSRLANSLKTWQRSTTGQDRLNSLAILAMENELAKRVDFSDVIDKFCKTKARRFHNAGP